jgi:alanine racemase
MATGTLTISLDAVVQNWRALDAMSQSGVQTAAVIKADGYGLGSDRVAKSLANAGAKTFFVATAQEGAKVRQALGPGLDIMVFGGHMRGDTDIINDLHLTPLLNSVEQLTRHFEALPSAPFGIQLDSGNEPAWHGTRRMGRCARRCPWSRPRLSDEPSGLCGRA